MSSATQLPQNATRERIMDVAEALFMARGYSAVKLRDIAEAVDMRHASLYYYVPKGKKQLFAAVMRRSLERHAREMERVIGAAGEDIRQQAYAVSDWLVSQPPLDVTRLLEADLPAIDSATAAELTDLMLDSLTRPFITAIEQAQSSGSVTAIDAGVAAMSLITLVQSVHSIPAASLPNGRSAFGRQLVDLLLNGLLTR